MRTKGHTSMFHSIGKPRMKSIKWLLVLRCIPIFFILSNLNSQVMKSQLVNSFLGLKNPQHVSLEPTQNSLLPSIKRVFLSEGCKNGTMSLIRHFQHTTPKIRWDLNKIKQGKFPINLRSARHFQRRGALPVVCLQLERSQLRARVAKDRQH